MHGVRRAANMGGSLIVGQEEYIVVKKSEQGVEKVEKRAPKTLLRKEVMEQYGLTEEELGDAL